ncbi:pleurocidin-like peptide WF3 [Nerophis lumbriciformis]|uniref:pleurocidin-like peptide WF3 n=1 Tax=Nerophis lumbriciformis TaxID=546530 RepID=UPI002ADF39F1|nr:pleurocidin-like peptide WF3 [Nerophis lumbriciformis]
MKCTAAFLVLFMVVLMAEPGECIFGLIFHGIKAIHELIHGHGDFEEQEQMNKRSVEFMPGRPGFD